MAYKTSDGKSFPNIGAALHAARWGEFGDRKTVKLMREGYFDTTIAKGGPAGWYVKDMGDPKPKSKKPKLKIKYQCINGRCMKVKL